MHLHRLPVFLPFLFILYAPPRSAALPSTCLPVSPVRLVAASPSPPARASLFRVLDRPNAENAHTLRLGLRNPQRGSLAYSLVSQQGILVEKRTVRLRKNRYELTLSLSDLPVGTYTLDLHLNDHTEQLTVERNAPASTPTNR